MLALTRRLGETLVINDDIRITVVDIRTSQIKLAIDAPDDTRVYREELWLRLRENPPVT